uniref:hypothetical protein n=1 Tax=Alloprevotella sp. TaxID=1872471 RepID=UPI003FF06B10
MGKIKHLFLLCMLFTLSVITTKAQTAVDYQTSTAPSNGSFAADTHWFTIYLRGTYLSVENVDADSYLYGGNSFNTINNTIDKGLWCVVGDETKGYKFYNKSIGPTKVLAINYVSDDTGGKARAKMVDASTENATTKGADNWLTTFDLYKNVRGDCVGAFSVSVKGLTNYYLNQRGSYLAFWISEKAKEEVGSAFYFYDKSSYVGPAKTLVTTYTDKTGGIYQPTAEELSAFSSKIPTDYTWDNLSSVWTSVNNAIVDFKAAIDKHTPTVGKRYLIKNSHNSKYIVPNIIPGSALNVQTGDITKDAVWTLEAGATEGTYKLKNAWSGLYINGVKANTTGTDLKVVTANVYNNTVAIGTGTYEESQQTWLHGNQDPLILWTASAGASRWTFTEVSDADFDTYAALPSSYISTLVNNAKNFLGVDVATEKKALQDNPTYANYLTYYNKVKAGTDNQYVRLQCAKSGNNRFMGLNDAYTEANSLEASTQKTNLSNIWKLVPVDGEEFCYRLMNANTGTYITNIQNAVNGANKPNPTLTTDESTGYKFTFTLKNETNGNWNVIDQNSNQLNAETDGRINYWTHGGNAGWWIFKATDIEVALHELGDASYASLYLPYSISAVSNADAYVANNAAVNNTLVMQTTSDGGFAANQGVVLVSDTKASTATLTLGENPNTSLLRGTSRPITLTDETRANYLVFGPKDGAENTVGFWTPATLLTSIAANRAYYLNEGGQQAVRLVFNGSVIEGIDHVVDVNDNVNAPIYDLMGRRVNNTMKHGVYIQNGKKMIVK